MPDRRDNRPESLNPNQRNPRLRIYLFPQMLWALCQHHLACRPYLRLQQMSSMCGPVAPSDHHMRMNLRLAILQSNVSDQRKQFNLLLKPDRCLIFLRFPVEPPQLH
jgi:hypothetical protein